MTDKIIKIENGLEYYVLEVLVENGKIYLLCSEVDTNNDDLKNNLSVLKVIENKDGLLIEREKDDKQRFFIAEKFMKLINKEF